MKTLSRLWCVCVIRHQTKAISISIQHHHSLFTGINWNMIHELFVVLLLLLLMGFSLFVSIVHLPIRQSCDNVSSFYFSENGKIKYLPIPRCILHVYNQENTTALLSHNRRIYVYACIEIVCISMENHVQHWKNCQYSAHSIFSCSIISRSIFSRSIISRSICSRSIFSRSIFSIPRYS